MEKLLSIFKWFGEWVIGPLLAIILKEFYDNWCHPKKLISKIYRDDGELTILEILERLEEISFGSKKKNLEKIWRLFWRGKLANENGFKLKDSSKNCTYCPNDKDVSFTRENLSLLMTSQFNILDIKSETSFELTQITAIEEAAKNEEWDRLATFPIQSWCVFTENGNIDETRKFSNFLKAYFLSMSIPRSSFIAMVKNSKEFFLV